ncbi:HlyD family efflux transporter periplasmic adaptor subunit [Achromobacter aloeverae]|uniref:Uncharacterized protein n=1 Tax=Achromobacter aloeverae TaxID=1750518 RepID=A0A4Q1HLM8_9BURK|nr:HlyD family efflux transporter periplasmic adaptor subunit [Achromobacter aloeverae]RXN90555.1 hypothetical protein C7R54_13820 [Achromobacter aloeverae]
MRKTVIVCVILVAAIAAGLWLWLRPAADNRLITLYGNIDIRQVSLAFEGSERVREVRVEEGDKVKAGQVLAVLDTRTLALQLAQVRAQADAQQEALARLRNGTRPEEVEQSQAQVGAAEAQTELAAQQLRRLRGVAADTHGRGVSKQDIDNAVAQLRVAQANLEDRRKSLKLARIGPRQEDIAQAQASLRAAEAQAALLQHQIDLGQLTAPRDGIVRARLLEPGDMASPQRPVYTLALTDPKWVRAYVNETQLGFVRGGMHADVYTDSSNKRALPGRVGYISSVAEFTPKSVQTEDLRTDLVYEVRVLVDDPRDELRLGMPATVVLQRQADDAPGAPAASTLSAPAAPTIAANTPARRQ